MCIRLALAFVLIPCVAVTVLAQSLDLDRVKELKDKGKEHFEESANVDLSTSKRNKHRKEAFKYLTEAFQILDAWCEKHPADAERYEDLMVEIHQMRYWLRKESPVGLLEGDGDNVRKGTPPGWPEKPPDDLDKPAEKPKPGVPPAGPAPAAPKPREPDEDPVEKNMKYAEDYARAHPYDLAGIRDLYLDILAHTQPGSAAYVSALKRISDVNSRMKDFYRRLRDEDPDELDLTGGEERQMVHELSKDLKEKEADVRLRAAEYLGLLGSGDGARHLTAALKKEKDDRVKEMIFASLARLGGSKTTKELAKLRRERKEWIQVGAISVLEKMVRRSPVEGRHAALSLGEFVFSRFDTVANQALGLLEGLGKGGTLGLMNAAGIKDHQKKLRIIRALGNTGEGRAAAVLGAFLIGAAKGRYREYRTAAEEALKKIGKSTVPHLARFVDHNRNGPYARYVLRQITGVFFKTGDAARRWWERNK
ncbi:MAG: HEAT repeat domain-containing protein [Planctomycetota bacterium]